MVTNAFNKYSIFAGATAGAAVYATTLFLTPATMGAITFAVSSFFLSLVGSAVAAVALGYALPILASMIVGALLAVAFNALFNAMKPKDPALNISNSISTNCGSELAVSPAALENDTNKDGHDAPQEHVVKGSSRTASISNGF
ncbi:MAG TPA: hypothetical protein DCZ80_04320 [Legionellales bacterium]|nr:hypothetical protein [Legionellales bacterium]